MRFLTSNANMPNKIKVMKLKNNGTQQNYVYLLTLKRGSYSGYLNISIACF